MKPPTNWTAIVAATGGGWNLSHDFLSLKAKHQLRDKHGRFIKEHSLVRWLEDNDNGAMHYHWGEVEGFAPDGSHVAVKENGKPGLHEIKPKQLEVIKAIIPNKPSDVHPTSLKPGDHVKVSKNGSTWKVTKPFEENHTGSGHGHVEVVNPTFGHKGHLTGHKDDKTWSVQKQGGETQFETYASGENMPEGEPLYINTEGFKKVGGQAGSNSGGFYEAPDGTRYYIKKAQTEQHAANELAAARIYQMAGVNVPDVYLTDQNGQPAIASKVVPGLTPMFPNGKTSAAGLAEARKGFAMDAWLSNWDSIGLEYDNMMKDTHGNAVRVDTGGSLIYRAQGSPKGNLFGSTVGETTTLRDKGMNPQAAKIFGGMTDAQLKADVADTVNKVDENKVNALIDELPFSSQQVKDDLKKTLAARKEDLNKQVGIEAPSTPNAEATPSGDKLTPGGKSILHGSDLKPGDEVQAISDTYPDGAPITSVVDSVDGNSVQVHNKDKPGQKFEFTTDKTFVKAGTGPTPSTAPDAATYGPLAKENPDGTVSVMAMSLKKGQLVKLNDGTVAEVVKTHTGLTGLNFTGLTGPKAGQDIHHQSFKGDKYNVVPPDSALGKEALAAKEGGTPSAQGTVKASDLKEGDLVQLPNGNGIAQITQAWDGANYQLTALTGPHEGKTIGAGKDGGATVFTKVDPTSDAGKNALAQAPANGEPSGQHGPEGVSTAPVTAHNLVQGDFIRTGNKVYYVATPWSKKSQTIALTDVSTGETKLFPASNQKMFSKFNGTPNSAKDFSPKAPVTEHAGEKIFSEDSFQPPQVKQPAEFATFEQQALENYVEDHGYQDINGFLRSGDPQFETSFYSDHEELQKDVQALDSALQDSVIQHDAIVYRGAGSGALPSGPLTPGTILSDKGFLSTTSKISIAKGFASDNGPKDERVIFEIHVPAGAHGIDMDKATSNYESEFLFGRNTELQVAEEGVYKDGTRYVVANLLPSGVHVPQENAPTGLPTGLDANNTQLTAFKDIQVGDFVKLPDGTVAELLSFESNHSGGEFKGVEGPRAGKNIKVKTYSSMKFDKVLPTGAEAHDVKEPKNYDDPGATKAPKVDQAHGNADQHSAVQVYTGYGHSYINPYLRGHLTEQGMTGAYTKEKLDGYVANLDTLIATSKTTNDSTVFRGMTQGPSLKFDSFEVGSVITDNGFVSTTSEYNVAKKDFSSENSKSAIFEIHIPAGSQALDATKAGSIHDEYEFILPRGSSFKVTEVGVQTNGTRYIVADLVPGGEHDTAKEAVPAGQGQGEGVPGAPDLGPGGHHGDAPAEGAPAVAGEVTSPGAENGAGLTTLGAPPTGAEQAALLTYTDAAFYKVINSSLRNDEMPKGHENTVQALDGLIAKSVASNDVTLVRGIHGTDWPPANLAPGTTLTDKAFISASTEDHIAEFFSHDGVHNSDGSIVEISVPKGYNLLSANDVLAADSSTKSLNEYILPRGTAFTVISDTTGADGKRHIHVSVGAATPTGPGEKSWPDSADNPDDAPAPGYQMAAAHLQSLLDEQGADHGLDSGGGEEHLKQWLNGYADQVLNGQLDETSQVDQAVTALAQELGVDLPSNDAQVNKTAEFTPAGSLHVGDKVSWNGKQATVTALISQNSDGAHVVVLNPDHGNPTVETITADQLVPVTEAVPSEPDTTPKTPVGALSVGDTFQLANGVTWTVTEIQDVHGLTGAKKLTVEDGSGKEVTYSQPADAMFHVVKKAAPTQSPESPTETAKPDLPTGTLVPGSDHVYQDAQGAYVITKNGDVLRKGDTVTSTKDGFTGKIVQLEKGPHYVKVQGADGKIKGRHMDTMVPAAKHVPDAAAPAAPAASPPAESPEPAPVSVKGSTLKPGDTIHYKNGGTFGVLVSGKPAPGGGTAWTVQTPKGHSTPLFTTDHGNYMVTKGEPQPDAPQAPEDKGPGAPDAPNGPISPKDLKPGDTIEDKFGNGGGTVTSVEPVTLNLTKVTYTDPAGHEQSEKVWNYDTGFFTKTNGPAPSSDGPQIQNLNEVKETAPAGPQVGDPIAPKDIVPGMVVGLPGPGSNNNYKVNAVKTLPNGIISLDLTSLKLGTNYPDHPMSPDKSDWVIKELPSVGAAPNPSIYGDKKPGEKIQPADMKPGMLLKGGNTGILWKVESEPQLHGNTYQVVMTDTATGETTTKSLSGGINYKYFVPDLQDQPKSEGVTAPAAEPGTVFHPSDWKVGDFIDPGASSGTVYQVTGIKTLPSGTLSVDLQNTTTGKPTSGLHYDPNYNGFKVHDPSKIGPHTIDGSHQTPETPSGPGGSLVAGSSHVYQDAQGRYTVNKQGWVLREGMQVISTKDGHAGTIQKLELGPKYAKVKGPDGTIKGRQVDTLKPVDPNAQKATSLPNAAGTVTPSTPSAGAHSNINTPGETPDALKGKSFIQAGVTNPEDFKPGDVVGKNKQLVEWTKPNAAKPTKIDVKFADQPGPLTLHKTNSWEKWEPTLPGAIGTKTPDAFQPGDVVGPDENHKQVVSKVSEWGDTPGHVDVLFQGQSEWQFIPENASWHQWPKGTAPSAPGATFPAAQEETGPVQLSHDPITHSFTEGGQVSIPAGGALYKAQYWSKDQPVLIDGFNTGWTVNPSTGELTKLSDSTVGYYKNSLGASNVIEKNENQAEVEPHLDQVFSPEELNALKSTVQEKIDEASDYFSTKNILTALQKFLNDPTGESLNSTDWNNATASLQHVFAGKDDTNGQQGALKNELIKTQKKITGTYYREWAGPTYGSGQYHYNQNERKALGAVGLSPDTQSFITAKNSSPAGNKDAAAEIYAAVTDPSNQAVIDDLFGHGTAASIAKKTRGDRFIPALSGPQSPYAKPAPALPSTQGKNGELVSLGDDVLASDGQGGKVVLVTADGKLRVRRSDGSHFTRKATQFVVTGTPVVSNKPTSKQLSEAGVYKPKPRPEFQVPDWSKGNVGGTSTPADALAKIKTSDRAGNVGWSFAAGGSQIEDMDVHVSRVKDAQGHELIELKFKLTPKQGNAMYKRHSADPNWSESSIKIEHRQTTSADKLAQFTGTNTYSGSGGLTLTHTTGGGAKIFFHVAKTKEMSNSKDNPVAFHNLVQIRMPADSSTADIAKAMYDAGVDDPSAPSPQAIVQYGENRLMSLFGQKTNAWSGNDALGPAVRASVLDSIEKKWGVKAIDLQIAHGANGRFELRLPQSVADKIQKATGVNYFIHSLHGGSGDLRTKVGPTGFDALLSTTVRFTEGMKYTGSSSYEDIHTGGADYVFTRPKSTLAPLSNHIVYDASRLFTRMDYINFNYDAWGKRNNSMDIVGSLSPSSTETDWKHRLDLADAVGFLVSTPTQRSELIQSLKDAGITEMGGRPVEDFIIVTPNSNIKAPTPAVATVPVSSLFAGGTP